jgi:hypothetical protein
MHHVVLDAEFLEATMQMEPEAVCFVMGHDFVREPLLFDHANSHSKCNRESGAFGTFRESWFWGNGRRRSAL